MKVSVGERLCGCDILALCKTQWGFRYYEKILEIIFAKVNSLRMKFFFPLNDI